jgi:ABC-type polysaccharide/polyol phosphate transport system, ATPase component
MNAIEIRNMSKSFKVQYDHAKTLKDFLVSHHRGKTEKHEVLKNISLDIQKGETVGLIGTNGSGKSTLLKLMTKIIYPNEGTVQTQGKLTSLLELGAGFHPDFTGRENIYFNAAIFGLTEKEINARIDEIIEFSELGPAIDEPIRTYSSGMYMRLAFSIAINVDAEILLIDEILAVGDQHFQDKCYQKLKELKASDKTIVIVSHSLEVVKELCTRAIWIYDGHFRLDGDPTYVIDEYLKQIAIDTKEKKKAALEQGDYSFKGAVYIDAPRNFTSLSLDARNVDIVGWKISDCEKESFTLSIGDKEVTDILPVRREDVFDIYREEYSGYITADTIGWSAAVNWREYEDQIDADGHLTITAKLCDDQKNIINEKAITITVDKESN